MRKFIYIISLALTLSVFSSCDSMLDEVNYGNPTVSDMMTNEENVVLLVGQAYADLKWIHDHWGYFGVSSLTADECLCPTRGDDWADGGYWRNLNTHKFDIHAKAFENIWKMTISGAVLCNKLIQTLADSRESMNPAVYAQYVGELEVLRSYYYYLLFDCFGRIPYTEDYSDESRPLMAPQETWSALVNCLERNAPNMAVVTDGNRSANYGRTTQGFAYALLARLYLNATSFGCTPDNVSLSDNSQYRPDFKAIAGEADFYTNAVACCDRVINSGSYSIEPDFFTNFKIKNEDSKENIFVIVEDGRADFDERSGPDGNMKNKLRVLFLSLHYQQQEAYGTQLDCWNGFCARPSYLERYNRRDVRGTGDEGLGTNDTHHWGWFVGPICRKGSTTPLKDKRGNDAVVFPTVSSLTDAAIGDGARMFKYEVDREGKYKYCENDFVLMRYADVLWMKEEAILRGGQGTSGYNTSDFRTLRNRTFAYEADPEAAYSSAYPTVLTLDGILDERGREFAWELVRRRDLIRYGKFGDPGYVEYVTDTDKNRNWFPIPYSVIEKSVRDKDGMPLWTQNPGYDTI